LEQVNRYKQLSAIYNAGSFFYGMFDNKEMLLSKLLANDQLSNITAEVSKKIAVRNSYFSILPNKAYDQKVKLKVLQSIPQFSSLKNTVVMEDEIDDKTVVVWGMDKKTFSSLNDLKNVNKMMHFSSAFIRACLSKNQNGVFIHALEDHLDVVLIIDGKLALYNFIDYQNKEDLLYYTLLYKSKTGNDRADVYLSGECNHKQRDFIKGYIENVNLLTLDFKIPAAFQAKEFYTGIQAVHLCV